jgi:hypothetical protein
MVVPSLRPETSDESLGFNDKPIRTECHRCVTLLSRRGTGKPLWILTIDSLFARSLLCAEGWLGECDQWFQTSVSICVVLQKNGQLPNAQLRLRPASGTASLPRILPAERSNAALQLVRLRSLPERTNRLAFRDENAPPASGGVFILGPIKSKTQEIP